MELNAFIGSRFFTADQELFFRSYIDAIYFTETGDAEQPESDAELTENSFDSAYHDCRRFFNVYSELFQLWKPDIEQAEELTRACRVFGEAYPEFEGS